VDVFPVFFDVVEYLGVEYGLTWPGSGNCAFTSCSNLHIGGIEQPGDGIAQAWTSCQWGPTGSSVVPGFGWIEVTEPGMVSLVPHPETGMIRILDCADGLDAPVGIYCAGLCGESGDPPCWLWPYMELTKTCGNDSGCVNTGDTLSYTISYENQHWEALDGVVILDYLPIGAEYVSASDGGVYDPAAHTVTWLLGTVHMDGAGWVEVAVRVVSRAVAGDAILNTCQIAAEGATVRAAWNSTPLCIAATEPTTWGKIKSIFR
jgi:uncharacterized repeat protein (TIGR01451 family)